MQTYKISRGSNTPLTHTNTHRHTHTVLWLPYIQWCEVKKKTSWRICLLQMPGFSLRKELIPLCQLFWLSFWRHPFTAEDLVKKWCNYTFLQICSDDGTNVSTDGLRVNKCSANVPFGVNYSFEYFTELGDLILCLLQWDTYVFLVFPCKPHCDSFPSFDGLAEQCS